MKNKYGLLVILFGITLLLNKKIYLRKNVIYQNNIINKIKDNHIEKNIDYIEIPKYNIKRIIKDNACYKVLDNYYVGYVKNDNKKLTIIAGHDVNIVFHKIRYLRKNDLIYVNDNSYIVYDYKEINVNDYSYINKQYNKKTIMLITCTKEKNKRYIVLAH